MKTLQELDRCNDDYGTHGRVYRNLAQQNRIVKELMETLNEPYVLREDCSEVVVCETIPRCYHEHDCCACVISREFIVRDMFTESRTCINI
jgi:hypothetical protein